ncbi:MAG: DUF1080 domain-containing protein [Ferruginibacter sp.]
MNSLSDTEIKNGWQLLFDGDTLHGWHGYNRNDIGQGWQVTETTLHFDGSPKEEASKTVCNDIVTDAIFPDFHLKIDWKISVNGNSGIMFLVQEDQQYRTPWLTGPEMQVLDDEGHQDGQLEKHRAGDLYDLIAGSTKSVKPVGEWNSVDIILENSRLVFIQNDVEIVSTVLWDDDWNKLVAGSKFKDMPDFAKSGHGRIALQDHGGPVWFRNIKIRPL